MSENTKLIFFLYSELYRLHYKQNSYYFTILKYFFQELGHVLKVLLKIKLHTLKNVLLCLECIQVSEMYCSPYYADYVCGKLS